MITLSNRARLCIRDALVAASSSLTSASVLTAFFIRGGMSDVRISVYMSVTQLCNLIISLLFAGITEKYRDTKRSASMLYTAGGAAVLMLIPFTAFEFSEGVFYTAMMIIGCLIQTAAAVRFVFEYKLPCEVMDTGDYSTYVALSNMCGGAAGIIAGLTLSALLGSFGFMAVMGCAFTAAAILLFGASAFNSSLKIIHEVGGNSLIRSDPLTSIRRLMKNACFRALIVPNFIRGIGAGVIAMITVVAIKSVGLEENDVPLVTTTTYIGMLASCLIYIYSAKRLGAPLSGLIGGAAFLTLSFSMTGSKYIFLAVYTFAYTGYNIVCCAIPDMVFQSVRPDIMGAFNTWRMIMTTLGTALSTALIGYLLEYIPADVITSAGSLAVFVCSLWYYLYYHSIKSYIEKEACNKKGQQT